MNRKKNSAFLRLRSFQSNIMTPRRKWLSPTSMHLVLLLCCLRFAALWAEVASASTPVPVGAEAFPRSLESYNDTDLGGIRAILKNRVQQEPFNLFATLIFFLAIVHTFMAARFMAVSHKWEHAHAEKIKAGQADRDSVHPGAKRLSEF